MFAKPTTLLVAATVACAFLAGVLFGGAQLPNALAQATPAQTLPPIFQVGNTVTFGPQGTVLSVLQTHGDWIFVQQATVGGFTTDAATDADNAANRFWLYVPSVQDSWRLVEPQ